MVYSKLYVKIEKDYQIIVVVYVDDIIFGGCKNEICKYFANQMQWEFEMFMIGKFSYFLGLQVNQLEKGIFISQFKYVKYVKEMLKKFTMEDCKAIGTPMNTRCKMRKVDKSPTIEQKMYKSMIGSLL